MRLGVFPELAHQFIAIHSASPQNLLMGIIRTNLFECQRLVHHFKIGSRGGT